MLIANIILTIIRKLGEILLMRLLMKELIWKFMLNLSLVPAKLNAALICVLITKSTEIGHVKITQP